MALLLLKVYQNEFALFSLAVTASKNIKNGYTLNEKVNGPRHEKIYNVVSEQVTPNRAVQAQRYREAENFGFRK